MTVQHNREPQAESGSQLSSSGSRLLDTITNVSIVAFIVCVLVVLVRRELRSEKSSAKVSAKPTFHADWKLYLSAGNRMGSATAPVQVIEFADFECPGCQRFSLLWRKVQNRYGDSVALTYIHFPLAYHKFALQTATVAECASGQGRFAEMYEVIHGKSDSIGLKSPVSYAQDAGVADTTKFTACVAQRDTLPLIRAGVALGNKIQIPGTPTILVNGSMIHSVASDDQFFEYIEHAMRASKKP